MRKVFRYGRKIRELREQRGWTQAHLAQAAGVEVRTIQRVEQEQTKSSETLLAVAGAFDVPLDSLRSTWLAPESRLQGTQVVTTWKNFVAAEEANRAHGFVRVNLAPLKDEYKEEINNLYEQVFADRELIEPDEPELWRSYIDSIREPLQELFDRGFSLFLLDEQRDLLLPANGILKPEKQYFDDWRIRYFHLVPRHGCFRLSLTEPLHSFNAECPAAGEVLFRMAKKRGVGLFVYLNAVFALDHSGSESAVSWCEQCFPFLPSGTRISFEYVERVTGLTRDQLISVYAAESEPPPLEGLS